MDFIFKHKKLLKIWSNLGFSFVFFFFWLGASITIRTMNKVRERNKGVNDTS